MNNKGKMQLEFSGLVRLGEYEHGYWQLWIGDADVAAVLEEAFHPILVDDPPRVRVVLWNAPAVTDNREGALRAWEGEHAYGTYTPGSGPEVSVGGWDLIKRLEELEDREVAMLVEEL